MNINEMKIKQMENKYERFFKFNNCFFFIYLYIFYIFFLIWNEIWVVDWAEYNCALG